MIQRFKNLITKYNTFIMYIFSAGISFGIDITLFAIFTKLLKSNMGDRAILLGTVGARIISSFINYLLNRNKVFKNKNQDLFDTSTFIKYYSLVVIQLCVSAVSVFLIYKLIKINETVIKIPVDMMIFIVNYFVQKYLIFKESSDGYEV
ncbi:MAG: GtrA family protein [Bacilli bacterium]|nr:GtrA family protein [Bacilli bacterium]